MIMISDYHDQIFNLIVKNIEDWNNISRFILYEFLSKSSTAQKLYNLSTFMTHFYYYFNPC